MPDDLRRPAAAHRAGRRGAEHPRRQPPGYEADDVLATLARAASKRGLDVYLCTSDKDCRQLIDDHVRLYNLRKHQEFGRAELLADWGVTPEQVVDLQSLVGDAVDNVPGVPGIGVKTAAKLLAGVRHARQPAGQRRQGGRRQAAGEPARRPRTIVDLSRQLVRLADDVPVSHGLGRLAAARHRRAEDAGLVPRVGLPHAGRTRSAKGPPYRPRPVQATLFPDERAASGDSASGDGEPKGESPSTDVRSPLAPPLATSATAPTAAVPWFKDYHLVDTAEKFQGFYRQSRQAEALRLRPGDDEPAARCEAEIVGLAFCWQAGRGVVPGGARAGRFAAARPGRRRWTGCGRSWKTRKSPRSTRTSSTTCWCCAARASRCAGVSGDPMVADYLLHAGERSHNLEELARRYLNHQVIPITDLIGKKSQETAAAAHGSGSDRPRRRPIPARTPTSAWRLALHLESRAGRAAARARSTTTWKSRSSRCWPSWSTTASASTCRCCSG